MGYCTYAEVKTAINYPSTGAPVADADITTFILQAETEIESIYKTKFGNIESSGTATAGASGTITDAAKTWTVDGYSGYVVWIDAGSGSGQYRGITANTATALTITPNWTTNPVSGSSTYKILKLGYKNDTVDGSDTDTQFIEYQPLINLIALTIDSTAVTTSNVYQYTDEGKLKLKSGAEVTTFKKSNPQLVNIKYIYGVYPLPQPIKRLCILLAGIKTLNAQLSGIYTSFDSVSLAGGFTGSRNQRESIIKSIDSLKKEAYEIIHGTEPYNYPSQRPYVVMG